MNLRPQLAAFCTLLLALGFGSTWALYGAETPDASVMAPPSNDPLPWTNVAPVQVETTFPKSEVSISVYEEPKAEGKMDREKYEIQVGDKISFRVMEDREEGKLLIVSPSGELMVPYVGRVQAAGKHLAEVQQDIKALLERDLYYQASVIMAVEEIAIQFKTRKIYVVGQVRAQGAQELPSDEKFTVSQAVLRAGGLASFANGKKVQVVRRTPDGKGERLFVNVIAVLKFGKIEEDLQCKPDDMIIVPEKLLNL